jgi:hypothetical protein
MEKSNFLDRQFRRPPLTDPIISLLIAAANATTPPGPAHKLNSQDAEGEFYNLILIDGRAERCDDFVLEHSKIVYFRAERPNQLDQLVWIVFDGKPKASNCRISVVNPIGLPRMQAHQW